AEARVKTNLTLEAIVDTEELEVTEEDIDKEIEKMAGMYNMEAEQIKGMLGGNTDMLKDDLKMQKAVNFLLDESKAVYEINKVRKYICTLFCLFKSDKRNNTKVNHVY